MDEAADSLFFNGRISTLNRGQPEVQALAVKDGVILAAGRTAEMQRHVQVHTPRIDLHRRVMPGLNDSHTHLIRAGLNHNMELRWDGVPTLADAMAMLRAPVKRTRPPLRGPALSVQTAFSCCSSVGTSSLTVGWMCTAREMTV